MFRGLLLLLSVLLCALSMLACGSSPRELVRGEDTCRYCRMTIDDVRFGALVETSRGKLETFDSIECLASFVAALPATEAPRAVWVADFDHAGRWLRADSALYVQHGRIASPMGRELLAVDGTRARAEVTQQHGGTVLTWREVSALVAHELSPSASGN